MSTLTVVQKDGVAAMAADQMTVVGSCKRPAQHRSRPSKIVHTGDSFLGVPGSTAHVRVLESLIHNHLAQFDLGSVDAIFETFRRLHRILVDEYYLVTEECSDQPYESSQMNILIANTTGIYEVQSYREVVKLERFWAIGSGDFFALGAMEAIYDEPARSAQQIAEKAVEIACLFDDGSGTPIESHTVKLV